MQLFNEEEESEVKPVHQLRCLSNLAVDLQKEIREMKTHPSPGTPPKVLQQRQQFASQSVSRLREAEHVCAEAVETIATSWEQLIDDAMVKQLAKQAWQADLKILALKAEIKKLPMKEKIARGTKLKELLNKARTLRD